MRRWIPLLFAGGLAVVSACNSDGVTTGEPTGTPTGTVTPTPSGATPTPTPTGNAWQLTDPTTSQKSCLLGGDLEEFPATTVIDINVTSTTFDPQWDLTGYVVAVQPSGTISGDNFTASWTTCQYDGFANTYKRVWTWTGTLNAAQTSFTNSTAVEVVSYFNTQITTAAGCLAAGTPTGDACNQPGLTWTISGTKQ